MKLLTIVVSFDVGEQVVPGGIPGWVASQVHEFGFQSAEATSIGALSQQFPFDSLQKHFRRAEHWVVVKGTAEVTRDNEVHLVQSIYLPIGCVHRMANPGRIDLELIEVQTGSYLGEDDIVRLHDVYNRG
jgi:mannose-6-phosphate isomerase-like protein (cupin superfamily)